MRLEKAALPPDSLGAAAFPRRDYVDAWRGFLPRPVEIDDLFKAFFRSSPRWVSSLLSLRNALVRMLGLKAPAGGREEMLRSLEVEAGRAVGLFRIFGKTQREVLAGEDDRHLDFRVSFFLETASVPDGPQTFVLATVVRFHNLPGRLYFAVVKPFHRLIVPAMMRSMVRSLGG